MMFFNKTRLNIGHMISLKSISEQFSKHHLMARYPQLKWLEKEIQHLWQVGYIQAETLWCMLGLGGWLMLTTMMWVAGRLEEIQVYEHSLNQVRHQPVRETLRVSSQRMFGEPVVVTTAAHSSWKVQGILYDDNPKKSEVLLKDALGKVQGFHQGETLPNGGRVVKITVDEVEIEENGAHLKLKIQKFPASFISDEPSSEGQKGLNLTE